MNSQKALHKECDFIKKKTEDFKQKNATQQETTLLDEKSVIVKKDVNTSEHIKETQESNLRQDHDHYWLRKLNREIEEEIDRERMKEDNSNEIESEEDWMIQKYNKHEKK